MTSSSTSRESRTVLVVDDHEGVREIACLSLRASGYHILSADSGDSAIDLLRGHDGPLHLVLLDSNMPGMTMKEVLDALSALRGDVPVLVMSGDAPRDVDVEGRPEGPERFLGKPFTPDQLRTAVRDAMKSAGPPRTPPTSRPPCDER